MVKQVECREAGIDCDFLIRSENEEELVDFVQQHAKDAHDLSMSESDVEGLMQEV